MNAKVLKQDHRVSSESGKKNIRLEERSLGGRQCRGSGYVNTRISY